MILISSEKKLNQLTGEELGEAVFIVDDRGKSYEISLLDGYNNVECIFLSDLVDTKAYWASSLKYSIELFDKLDSKIDEISSQELSYKGLSILDLDSDRYLSAHYEILANAIYRIKVLDELLESSTPERLSLLKPFTDWEHSALLVGNEKGIEINEINTSTKFDKETDYISKKGLLDFVPKKLHPSLRKLKLWGEYFTYGLNRRLNENINSDVLIYVINHKYLDIVLPLVESIKNDGKTLLVLVPKTFDSKEALLEESVPFEYIESFLTPSIVKRINSEYSRIYKNFGSLSKKSDFHNVFSFKGYNIFPLLEEQLSMTFRASSIYSLKYLFLIQRIIRESNAKAFFALHYAENTVKTLNAGCDLSGIGSINLKRGTAGFTPSYSTVNSDKLLVAGKYAKKEFMYWGVPESKIEITGQPIFQNLLSKMENKNLIETKIRNELDIPDSYNVITYLTQSYSRDFTPSEKVKEIRSVLSVFKKLKKSYMIIKLHPSESDIDVYHKLINELDLSDIAIRRDIDLDEVLVTSDLSLTKNSMAGFNALLTDNSLVILNFHGQNLDRNYFVKGGVAKIANNQGELFNYIKKGLNINFIDTDKLEGFIYNHFDKFDNDSVERIKEKVYSIAQE